jgi:hypothetical protein
MEKAREKNVHILGMRPVIMGLNRLKMGMPKRESRNFSQQWAATLNYTI